MSLSSGRLRAGPDSSACIRRRDRTSCDPEIHRREQTGLEGQPKSIGGGTYAKAIPNVVAFGPIFPGDEVREHKPDEFMEIDRLMENVHIFAEALYRLAR